jgi:hypothetical protein
MEPENDNSACERFALSWREDEIAHAKIKDIPCASRLRAHLERARLGRACSG